MPSTISVGYRPACSHSRATGANRSRQKSRRVLRDSCRAALSSKSMGSTPSRGRRRRAEGATGSQGGDPVGVVAEQRGQELVAVLVTPRRPPVGRGLATDADGAPELPDRAEARV